MLIKLLFQDPVAFLILVIPLLYSVIIHEIAHGWVAYLFGDDTAKRYGRLSMNPLAHLDPVGTIALLTIGFGWARPVPIDYSRVRNFRLGLICISLAGCAANILMATLAILMLQLPGAAQHRTIAWTMLNFAYINIMLGSLNLIPIPPLDGSRILLGILPERGQRILLRLEPFGMMILFGLLFTGLLNPAIMFVQKIIVAAIKSILRI